MSIVRNVLSAGLLCAAAVSAQTSVDLDAPVIIDDFNDIYTGSSAQQCNIGEVYGMVNYEGSAYSGGGYWYMFTDSLGSKVVNKAGDPIVRGSNEATMIPDSSMYVKLTTSTSTLQYPYAGIGCTFVGSNDGEYLDLSKMTSITMKVKGSGKVRMHFETKDIATKKYTWGWYGKEITLSSSWTELSIPVSDLKPESGSDPDKNSMTWSGGKTAVNKISFQAKNGADAVLQLDDIKLVGVTYKDLKFPAAKVINLRAPKSVNGFSVNGSVVSFNLPKAQELNVTLTDMMGNTVSTLFSGVASSKSITINDKHLSSGRYLVVAKGKNINFSESIVISK
jgi:Carbohydrate binding domain (family 11)